MSARIAPFPGFRPSRHFSSAADGRLEVSLCAVNRGFGVVWPTLAVASARQVRLVALVALAENLRDNVIPWAEEQEEPPHVVSALEDRLHRVELEIERMTSQRDDLGALRPFADLVLS